MVVKGRKEPGAGRASTLEAWLIVEAQGEGQRRWTALSRCQKRLMAQGEAAAGPTKVDSDFRNIFLRSLGFLVN